MKETAGQSAICQESLIVRWEEGEALLADEVSSKIQWRSNTRNAFTTFATRGIQTLHVCGHTHELPKVLPSISNLVLGHALMATSHIQDSSQDIRKVLLRMKMHDGMLDLIMGELIKDFRNMETLTDDITIQHRKEVRIDMRVVQLPKALSRFSRSDGPFPLIRSDNNELQPGGLSALISCLELRFQTPPHTGHNRRDVSSLSIDSWRHGSAAGGFHDSECWMETKIEEKGRGKEQRITRDWETPTERGNRVKTT